jgi:hypothetical protein
MRPRRQFQGKQQGAGGEAERGREAEQPGSVEDDDELT